MIFFKILWKSRADASSTQTQTLSKVSNPIEIVISYTEILTGKVVLLCFFTSEKIHKSTFEGKISV